MGPRALRRGGGSDPVSEHEITLDLRRVRIEHAGETWPNDDYDLCFTLDYLREQVRDGSADADELEELERLTAAIREGVIFSENEGGSPLQGVRLQRVRDRLLGTYDGLPGTSSLDSRRAREPKPRFLIETVWRHGTIPMLGGNAKAGKTSLVCDLCAALLLPERRFLDRFDVEPPAEEDGRWVYLINAETESESLEDALREQGLDGEYGHDLNSLSLDHLDEHGSPSVFDLTDPAKYALWAHRLSKCYDCDGTDDVAPDVVIVDGLTAILAAAGKGPEQYGLWFAAFKRLMRECDVPSALVVAHATMAGTHLLGGMESLAGPDGLWTYSASSPDNPGSARHFAVVPRLGGRAVPKTQVHLHDDGRLRLVKGSTKRAKPATTDPPRVQPIAEQSNGHKQPESDPEPIEDVPERSITDELLAYVGLCNAQGYGPSVRDLRVNVRGSNVLVDAARTALLKVEDGRLDERPRKGRGGGSSFWLAGSAEIAASVPTVPDELC